MERRARSRLCIWSVCHFSIDSGMIKLDIYRGADTPKAIKACEEMVKGFVSGKTPIEDHLLEGAKTW